MGSHTHGPADHGRAFALGTALNIAFVVMEAGIGLAVGSLALVADAGHNLTDVLGLALAWGGEVLSRRQPTPRRTYGLRRASILAALANAGLVLVAVGMITLEAIERLCSPEPVGTRTVIAVAALGVVVNGATALLFRSGRLADLNVRGAFVHMAADAAVSLGVVVSALLIRVTGAYWLDPLTALAIAAVILVGTWQLLRESLDLALDAVPAGIVSNEVAAYLHTVPGVVGAHDLHIWAMSTTETALTAHLVVEGHPAPARIDALLAEVAQGLVDRFDIHHTTLQVESGDMPCPTDCGRTITGVAAPRAQPIPRRG